MKKLILILLILTGAAGAYFEIREGVPGIWSQDGLEHWVMLSELGTTEETGLDLVSVAGIVFNEQHESIIVGTFTTGTVQSNISTFGYGAGQNAIGVAQSAFGRVAGYFNTGNFQSTFGQVSGFQNTGIRQSAFGSATGGFNDGANNTAIGATAFNAFGLDAGSAKELDSVDHANNQVTVDAGHDFGANGTYRNLQATSTNTLPAGLSPVVPEIWKVISATVLECITAVFTDGGTGTHTLTPQYVYTNSTALGYNAEPDASNQVMLGDTNVTEVKTSGQLTLVGDGRTWGIQAEFAAGFKAPGLKPATLAEEGLSFAWAFDDADDETVLGHFMTPSNIDRTNIVQPKVVLHWGCDDNTGNAYWQVEYLWIAPNEDMTNTTPDGTVPVIVAASGTADGYVRTEVQLDDFGASDTMLHLRIKRLGGDGSDTLTGDTHLHCMCIRYVTNTLGEAVGEDLLLLEDDSRFLLEDGTLMILEI